MTVLPRTSGSGRRGARLGVTAAAAVAAALLTAGCATGKIAATAYEKPTLDGTQTSIGSLRLDGIALSAPTTGSAYSAGATVPLQVVVTNRSGRADTLTGISSPAFAGWSIVATGDTAPATGNGGSRAIPADASVTLGLKNIGDGSQSAPESAVLTGLKLKKLYAGSTVAVTFTFRDAGSRTVPVPVQLTTSVPRQSVSPPPADG